MSSPNEKTTEKQPVDRKPISEIKDVGKGLEQCYDNLSFMAKKTGEAPENTRSNPADRVKRFREEANWVRGDYKDDVLRSNFYKQSAILFIHCVLSPLYGKNIYLKSDSFESLINQDTELKGRSYFLKKMQESLYDDSGLKINKNNLIRIYYNKKLIGLFSSSGPIPAISCPFLQEDSEEAFLKHLKIDDTSITKSLLKSLNDQEKQLVKFYLDEYGERGLIGDGLLDEMRKDLDDLKVGVSDTIVRNFRIDSSIPFSFPILREESEDQNIDILSDRLIVLPIYDANTEVGYSFVDTLKTLKFSTGEETRQLWYACIPPLTQNAIEMINDETFKLTSMSIDINKSNIGSVVSSLFVECEAELDGAKFYYSRRYSGEKLQFIDHFPVLYLYGIAPKFGFLARRNLEVVGGKPSPLENEKKMDVGKISDVELVDLEFENIDETYKYCLYVGEIPEWVGVRISGDWWGALPLRAGYVKDENWENDPPFVHKEFPKNSKMVVALDIGSSRSIALFKSGNDKCDSILMEKDQLLAVPIMPPVVNENEVEGEAFRRVRFQPVNSYAKREGKKPLSITSIGKKDESQTLLYKSGKFYFLDASLVNEVEGDPLISDIKSHIKDKKDIDSKKAMVILVQGLLSLIIERAIRAASSEIDIYTAYLTEQYGEMRNIWKEAIRGFEDIINKAEIKTVSHDNKKMEIFSNKNGKIDINVIPYLPESLAIANRLCVDKFEAGSGAAIIDIGDYSTDIAIFKNPDGDFDHVELLNNLSIYFGGRVIFLQAIWDYLKASLKHGGLDGVKDRLRDSFGLTISSKSNSSNRKISTEKKENDEVSYDGIFTKLIDEIEKNKSQELVSNNFRNAIFCIIDRLVDESNNFRNEKLKDLIDLGYLAEMLILKHCINEIKGRAIFNVYLFGGGSFCFENQKAGDNDGGFDWKEVLGGRDCKIHNKHSSVDMVASGLFYPIDKRIAVTADKEEAIAVNNDNNKKKNKKFPTSDKELKAAYRDFLESAKKLKKYWSFAQRANEDGSKNFLGVKLDENGEFVRDKDGRVQAESAKYIENVDASLRFASTCMPDGGDAEVFKILFAYRLAYLNLVQEYEEYGND